MKLLFFVLFGIYSSLTHANLQKEILDLIKDQKSLTSKQINSDSQKKLATVIYFLSSTCPCSQGHFDHLNSLQKSYPEFQFIGFHSSKSTPLKRAKRYFDQFTIDFPIYLDKKLKVANLLKALKTPHVFVLNKKGDFLFQGGATNSRNPKRADQFYLQKALRELKEGKPIETKVARALGCYIQR